MNTTEKFPVRNRFRDGDSIIILRKALGVDSHNKKAVIHKVDITEGPEAHLGGNVDKRM